MKERNVDLCTILLRILDLATQILELSVVPIEELFPLLLSSSHQVGTVYFYATLTTVN